MPRGTRIEWFDFAKGGSIVLVVVFHAALHLGRYDLVAPAYWFINNVFAPVRMPVFFFISGVLAAGALRSPWPDLLRRKVLVFVYLYAVWSALLLAGGVLTTGEGFNPADLVRVLYSPTSVLWFIWALAFYFVVAKLGLAYRAVALTLAALLSLATYGGVIAFDNFVHENVLMFLPCFLAGAYAGRRLADWSALGTVWLAAGSSIVFLAAFVAVYEGLVPEVLVGPARFVLAALGILVGSATSAWICRFGRLKALPIALGRSTLPIYVAHYPIAGALASGVAAVDPVVPGAELWGVPGVTVGAIVLSLLLRDALERIGLGILYAPPWLGRREAAAPAGAKRSA